MTNLIFTVVLNGILFTGPGGSFETAELCQQAAASLSGPNWVADCKSPDGQDVGGMYLDPELADHCHHASDGLIECF